MSASFTSSLVAFLLIALLLFVFLGRGLVGHFRFLDR